MCLEMPANALVEALTTHRADDAAGTSSCRDSSSHAAASAALLAVVFARSLVQLVDAMEAAGPEAYLKSLLGQPVFRVRWTREINPSTARAVYASKQFAPCGSEQQHTAEAQWQAWQLYLMTVMPPILLALECVGIAPPAAAAAGDVRVAAATSSGNGNSTAENCASSSSSSSQQVKWGYLLQLQQHSPQWTAAVAAYDAQQQVWSEAEGNALGTAGAAEQLEQQYAKIVALRRVLAAETPLPVVCNNPSCERLAGVSEAAAASKACAGCRCRYCSVTCQQADWK
jgi:hypothetical protein